MATTMFFGETVQGKDLDAPAMEIEIGRSSYYDRENLIYLNVDGKGVTMDEATGKRFVEAVESLGRYLGYNR